MLYVRVSIDNRNTLFADKQDLMNVLSKEIISLGASDTTGLALSFDTTLFSGSYPKMFHNFVLFLSSPLPKLHFGVF